VVTVVGGSGVVGVPPDRRPGARRPEPVGPPGGCSRPGPRAAVRPCLAGRYPAARPFRRKRACGRIPGHPGLAVQPGANSSALVLSCRSWGAYS